METITPLETAPKKRLVVGISGASGAPLAVHLLQTMRLFPEWETHGVLSAGGKRLLLEECGLSGDQLNSLADVMYDSQDLGAPIASGTFRTEGMVVIPCSMKTLAGIHSGYTDNLLLRAADVTLKERRLLALVPREAPFNQIHLRNMLEMSKLGAVILPPVLTFYNASQQIQDMIAHITGKTLALFGLTPPDFRPWCGG